jgi:parallel beta-helix repeat protein
MTIKPTLRRLLIVTTFLLVLGISQHTARSINPITQQILIVDPTGNGNYTSIQDAITHASTTDIIQIQPGTYYEDSISIDKKIDLVGAGTDTCVIDCKENQGFIIRSSFVTLSHLQITNTSDSAISIQPGCNGCNISSCEIKNLSKGNGIDILSSYNTLSHCSIHGVTQTGQALKIQGTYNTINDCTLQHFSNGILVINRATNNNIVNCNIFDNENAIDIRMNSHNNVVTNCNIYSNLQGIKIWQNSNDNTVYHNNVFKNDQPAIDEVKNKWDNGSKGNYWDVYRGVDVNQDGIGDTPFTISEQSADRFPYMTMLLPDIVIAPTDITQTTSTADPTPTFTWNPAIYSGGIAGYAVKIDTGQEIVIETSNWTSPSNLTNGVHTFVIRAIGADGKSSAPNALKFTIDIAFNDSDHDGWSDAEEIRYGTDPNNPQNYPLDTDGDHVPDSIDRDDDNDGYPDDLELSYGTNPKDSNDFPTDTDGDKVPDYDSPDGKYLGDVDRDGDGLLNTIEIQLGSDPANSSDVRKIYLGGDPFFLVDVTHDGIYDILYNPSSEKTSAVEYVDGAYQIDANGDGSWDYVYHPTDDSITSVQEPFITLPLILLSIGIICALIAIGIFSYVKKRFRIPKKLKAQTKKILPGITSIDKETAEMVTETRTLLNHIQRDVNTYIEKLNQIEKLTPAVGAKMEDQQLPEKEKATQKFKDHNEPPRTPQPISSFPSRYDNVSAEIDKLIETLHRKNT